MDQKNKSLSVLFFNRLHTAVHPMKYSRYFIAVLLINLMTLGVFCQTSADEQNSKSLSKQKALTESISLNSTEAMQGTTITGKITDANGDPLPGVNVLEKGTANGTITDVDGNYSIVVANGESVLIFSFVGYMTEEIPVGGQSEITITMIEDLIGLGEVVVVGYGTVKKSDVTGALASVSEEQIKEIPVMNVNQALQGRAAGVDVVTTSYGLNTKPEIRIRGNRSILAKNDPLYVVDGVPISGSIQDLNPGDIESVEILKDASASAIYGSRAANGVILITTKRGETGKFSVNVESSWSWVNPLRYYDQLSGHDWMEMARDNQRPGRYSTPYPNPEEDYDIVGDWTTAWLNAQKGYTWLESPGENPANWSYAMRAVTDDERARWEQVMDNVPDSVPLYSAGDVGSYDWYAEGMNRNALTQQHNISFSGGTEKISAYFSLGYIKQEGLGVGENYQRISPRLNLDLQPLEWLKLGVTAYFSSDLKDPGEGLLDGMANQIPVTTPYDTAGNFLILPTGDQTHKNPLRDEQLNVQEDRVYRYLGTYFAEISFPKGFKYRLNVSQDYRNYSEGDYRDAMSSPIFPSTSWARFIRGKSYYYSVENLLFYNREFGIHNIGVTLLQSFEVNRWDKTILTSDDIPFRNALWYDLSVSTDPSTDIHYESDPDDYPDPYGKTQMASFMGRVNYGLLDRYLLTASIRYDGSSVFYVDNQWDYFPSFALAWKINNESFMQNINFLSQLKLRFGYGTVGQSAVDPYQSNGTVKETQYTFYNPTAGDDVASKGLAPERLQTRTVGWEKTATTNIGVDFGFFQNRVSGSVELYRANTYDLLLEKSIPAINGTSSIRANVGKTRNEGLEITLYTFNINRRDFRWETDFTFMTNREQIVELADGAEDDIANRWFIGEPLRSWYTYEYDGIWQVGDSVLMEMYNENGRNGFEVGQIRPKDVDGNDTINTADQTVTGNNVPKYSIGLNNRFYYKGFELSFFIFARVGHSIFSRDGHYYPMSTRGSTRFLPNYYRPMATPEENAGVDHPAPQQGRDNFESALYVRKGSFLKVRHITLSYNIPNKLLDKVKIQTLKLSVQVINPFLFTKYPFLDPEAQRDASSQIRTPYGISPRGVTFSVRIGL